MSYWNDLKIYFLLPLLSRKQGVSDILLTFSFIYATKIFSGKILSMVNHLELVIIAKGYPLLVSSMVNFRIVWLGLFQKGSPNSEIPSNVQFFKWARMSTRSKAAIDEIRALIGKWWIYSIFIFLETDKAWYIVQWTPRCSRYHILVDEILRSSDETWGDFVCCCLLNHCKCVKFINIQKEHDEIKSNTDID